MKGFQLFQYLKTPQGSMSLDKQGSAVLSMLPACFRGP